MKINIAGFLSHHAVETNALVSILGVVIENMTVPPLQKALLNEGLSILANGAANLLKHAQDVAALPAAETVEVVAVAVPVAVPAPLVVVGEPVAVAEPVPATASEVAATPAPANPDPAPVDPAAVAAATSQAAAGNNEPAPAIPGGLPMEGEMPHASETAPAPIIEAVGTVNGQDVTATAEATPEPAPEPDVTADDGKWREMGYRFDPMDGRPL